MQFAYQLCIALYALLSVGMALKFSVIIYYEYAFQFNLKNQNIFGICYLNDH